VDPNLENLILEKTMGEIAQELEKTKSKIINHRLWGKKRLAYQIVNQKYGSFIILQFQGGTQSKMREFDIWMKLNNAVLRHMTILLSEKPDLYIEPNNEKIQENVDEGNGDKKLTKKGLDENKEAVTEKKDSDELPKEET